MALIRQSLEYETSFERFRVLESEYEYTEERGYPLRSGEPGG